MNYRVQRHMLRDRRVLSTSKTTSVPEGVAEEGVAAPTTRRSEFLLCMDYVWTLCDCGLRRSWFETIMVLIVDVVCELWTWFVNCGCDL